MRRRTLTAQTVIMRCNRELSSTRISHCCDETRAKRLVEGSPRRHSRQAQHLRTWHLRAWHAKRRAQRSWTLVGHWRGRRRTVAESPPLGSRHASLRRQHGGAATCKCGSRRQPLATVPRRIGAARRRPCWCFAALPLWWKQPHRSPCSHGAGGRGHRRMPGDDRVVGARRVGAT